MVKRNPLWIRLIAGAGFIYAWVLIVYTPPKHKHTISLKGDENEKQQLIKEVDDNFDTTTNNEAIAAVTLTESSIMTVPKTVPATNPFPSGAILLVGDGESANEKPATKKPEIIGANKNVPDKQLESTHSKGKQEVPAGADRGQNQSSDRQDSSQTNKNELPIAKSTDQAALVPQIKDAHKTPQSIPSDRTNPQINENNLLTTKSPNQPAMVSEATNARGTSVNVPSAALENKPSHQLESNSYPEPHDVSIQPPGVCPRSDVVTIIGGGRLANCIWEYVTVWSLSRFLPGNRAPFAQKLIVDTLSKVFDGVNLPTVEDLPRDCECCKSTNWTSANVQVFDFIPLTNVTTRFSDFKGHIILSKYSLLLEPVLATINQLKKEFKYKEELVISAQNVIRNKTALYMKSVKAMDNTKLVYVGVHVRRTDYIKYLSDTHNMTATGPEYFIAAMNYFRKHTALGKPIFLVVSDDVTWVENNLQGNDVFVVSRGGIDNPGYDIALLSHCNHSIIDYGTYGLWAAVYAGGETITIKTTTQIYKILSEKPNWHFVRTSPTGELEIP